ncbi:5700_t:CDS:10 [Paraglomus occultum]|uniref:5700_t:CDS:1 n=1 Tax=Paraglomus occultum TaxID=144539 RepID=A0A9N8ZWI4_9GLOM|nr:5700_t:CDS:10 [Paraglomus occultum]
MQGRDGRSKGHGIVLFATVGDAQKAIAAFDGHEWYGRRLEVREDRSAMDYPPPPPRTESANANSQNDVSLYEDNDVSTTPNGLSAASTEINNGASSSSQPSSPIEYVSVNDNININGTNVNANINGTITGNSSNQDDPAVTNGTTTAVSSTTSSPITNVSNANGLKDVGSIVQRQLFVGNLPFRVRWQDLKDLFRKAGNVIRADVAMGYDNRSKGHGTVLFATVDDAKSAIAMFHSYNWQGRVLEVREDRGYVEQSAKNVNNGPNQYDMNRHMTESLITHPAGHYAHGAPMLAPGAMYYPHRNIQAPPTNNYAGRFLFVGNLPFNCQWQDLKDLFRAAGNIIRADVSTNYDGRSRGFGTVLFATPEDAQNAVGMFNGYEYNGRALRVHFDKYTLPQMHPHNPPHPHMAPPAVHPHHRHHPHPPMMAPHNFHLGHPPPMHHPHFMAPTMGPFSPPLANPSLTSPPYPTTYNPLAHLGTPNSANNNATSFQQIGVVANSHATTSQSTAATQINQDQTLQAVQSTQFPSFGPIGKNSAGQSNTVSATLAAVGSFSSLVSPGTNGLALSGVNGTDTAYGTDAIPSLASSMAGTIGSGLGSMNSTTTSNTTYAHHSSNPSVSSTTSTSSTLSSVGVHSSASSTTAVEPSTSPTKASLLSSSASTPTSTTVQPDPLWDAATGMLTSSGGGNGSNNASTAVANVMMSALTGMTTGLEKATAGGAAVVPQPMAIPAGAAREVFGRSM